MTEQIIIERLLLIIDAIGSDGLKQARDAYKRALVEAHAVLHRQRAALQEAIELAEDGRGHEAQDEVVREGEEALSAIWQRCADEVLSIPLMSIE